MSEPWYAQWFNTPYYHLLYKHRDDTEAQAFLENLVQTLNLPKTARVLDLACGRGRHAFTLHRLGYDVTGYDLSEANIAFAKRQEEAGLHFAVQDMLEPYDKAAFDVVMNLFTSFGYFNSHALNQQAIHHMAAALKPGGLLVMDFMNAHRVAEGLVPQEHITIDGVSFHISRRQAEGQVIKSIAFEAGGRHHLHEERVQALIMEDFKRYFEEAGLHLRHTFGNAKGDPFDPETSPRLILTATKP